MRKPGTDHFIAEGFWPLEIGALDVSSPLMQWFIWLLLLSGITNSCLGASAKIIKVLPQFLTWNAAIRSALVSMIATRIRQNCAGN